MNFFANTRFKFVRLTQTYKEYNQHDEHYTDYWERFTVKYDRCRFTRIENNWCLRIMSPLCFNKKFL